MELIGIKTKMNSENSTLPLKRDRYNFVSFKHTFILERNQYSVGAKLDNVAWVLWGKQKCFS